MSLYERIKSGEESLSLVGLGYVGMPIAVAFANEGVNVIGFDLNTAKIDLSGLQNQRQQLFHSIILAHSRQAFIEEMADGLISEAQHFRVPCVGRHALQTEKNQRFQGADIFIVRPQLFQIVIPVVATGILAQGTVRGQRIFRLMDPPDPVPERVVIEIDVGEGGKQAAHHQFIGFLGGAVLLHRSGQADQSPHQLILEPGGGGFFAAYSCIFGTAGTSGCLLTLKTKHLVFHGNSPFVVDFRRRQAIRPAVCGSAPTIRQPGREVCCYYNKMRKDLSAAFPALRQHIPLLRNREIKKTKNKIKIVVLC